MSRKEEGYIKAQEIFTAGTEAISFAVFGKRNSRTNKQIFGNGVRDKTVEGLLGVVDLWGDFDHALFSWRVADTNLKEHIKMKDGANRNNKYRLRGEVCMMGETTSIFAIRLFP